MCGCVQRLELESYNYEKVDKKPILTLVWAANANHPQTVTQTITLFTSVVCRLAAAANEPMKWTVHITVLLVTKPPSSIIICVVCFMWYIRYATTCVNTLGNFIFCWDLGFYLKLGLKCN